MATPHPMTLPLEGTTLLIVDVQERLFPAMDADHREEVMRNIKVLVATARRLRLPVVATEQYPKGLGHTLRELSEALGPEVQPLPKVSFSCWAALTGRPADWRASAARFENRSISSLRARPASRRRRRPTRVARPAGSGWLRPRRAWSGSSVRRRMDCIAP